MRWYGLVFVYTISSVYSDASANAVRASAFTSATVSSAMTSTPRARRPNTPRGSSGSSSQVAHRPTTAFRMPNTSDVRTRPSFGTSRMGNSTDANSAPR